MYANIERAEAGVLVLTVKGYSASEAFLRALVGLKGASWFDALAVWYLIFAVFVGSLICTALRSSRYDLVAAVGGLAGIAALASAPVHCAMLLNAQFLPRKDGLPTFYLIDAYGSPFLDADSSGIIYYYGGFGLPILAVSAFTVWRSRKAVTRKLAL
jgi:hypothetical protein